MKFDAQYEETDIAKNFDVAALRIYNENYIGRMRDLSILNACRPKNRVDLLVYKVLANIATCCFTSSVQKMQQNRSQGKCLVMQRYHFQLLIYYRELKCTLCFGLLFCNSKKILSLPFIWKHVLF